eukprot:TRINITY_DN2541_c0_g2_i1.p1 TRINITY_DN2541_c0_g2~~TRINITY_DN2541_c0_g2_i1.p1  ORF type:complete len:625 (+),score=105.37 TRINITY_DN2541_c0_g2_i1:90-1877(+)
MGRSYSSSSFGGDCYGSSVSSSSYSCGNCGRPGHNSRTCSYSSTSSSHHCSTCGRSGHNSRTCPYDNGRTLQSFADSYSSSSSSGSYSCSNCGQSGHNSRTCNYAAPAVVHACGTCGQSGHNSRTCAASIPSNSRKCSNCNEVGHYVSTCPAAARQHKCAVCRQSGHNAVTCPDKCQRCSGASHLIQHCPRKPCTRCHKQGHDSKSCDVCSHCSKVHDKDKCPKKIARVPLEKSGVKGETDAAHIFANEMANEILLYKLGPNYSEQTRKDIAKQLAKAANLRIKSIEGNRSVDRSNDRKIKDCMSTGKPLTKEALFRASLQYEILLLSEGLPSNFRDTALAKYGNLYWEDASGKRVYVAECADSKTRNLLRGRSSLAPVAAAAVDDVKEDPFDFTAPAPVVDHFKPRAAVSSHEVHSQVEGNCDFCGRASVALSDDWSGDVQLCVECVAGGFNYPPRSIGGGCEQKVVHQVDVAQSESREKEPQTISRAAVSSHEVHSQVEGNCDFCGRAAVALSDDWSGDVQLCVECVAGGFNYPASSIGGGNEQKVVQVVKSDLHQAKSHVISCDMCAKSVFKAESVEIGDLTVCLECYGATL